MVIVEVLSWINKGGILDGREEKILSKVMVRMGYVDSVCSGRNIFYVEI